VGGDGRAGDQLKATKSKKKLVVGCNPACPKNLGDMCGGNFLRQATECGAPRRPRFHNQLGAQIRVRGAHGLCMTFQGKKIALKPHEVEYKARKVYFLSIWNLVTVTLGNP